jgi:hypothetical protein
MLGDLLKGVIGPIIKPFTRLIPDPNARAEAEEQLEANMLTAITGLVQGQLAINAKEAEHGSIFVAGWRPFIGWICGAALAWSFLLSPFVTWIAFMLGANLEGIPVLDVGPLMTLVLGMLGLGGLRTYEKRLGVARTGVGPNQ